MGNVGHFDVEIDSQFLLTKSKSVKEDRPEIRGMVHAVRHMITVEEVELYMVFYL